MRRFTAFLLAVIVTACTPELDTSTRPDSVVGTYQLRSYGGQPLPTETSADEEGTIELLSGELVIGTDKSWAETRTYRYTQTGSVQDISFGSAGSWVYLREGADMQFNDKVLGYQFTGTAAGGTVTLNLNDGHTLIYSR
jgi:hypothetical protein